MEKRLRILLLEDLQTDAELILDELEMAGLEFDYEQVDNEPDFIEKLTGFKPDIVLSDYSLPTFNGMAAIELVKKHCPHTPVIMVTASINEETAVACMRAGAMDYILKDKMKRLGMAVRSVLENQQLKLQKLQAEKALQESERYYRTMMNQMNEHVIVINRDYVVTDVNQSFLEHHGISRLEAVGRHCYTLHNDFGKSCNQQNQPCILPNVFETGQPEQFIRQQHNAKGERVWYNISISPMIDADGAVSAVIESSTDISELMRAHEEIQKLSMAIEQSPVSVVLTDDKGVIEYINPHFTQNTGYSKQETLGAKANLLKSGTQDKNFYKELWETILSGETWHGEFHNKKKDGALFWEDATIGPIVNDQGVITHFLAVKEDITEKKKLGEELIQAQKMEAVGRLAGGVAHDFNNLLTVINGYSDLAIAKIGTLSPVTANYIKQIAHAGKKASSLTQQLLAFSRKQVMKPKILDPNQTIIDMSTMLQRLIGENIELHVRLQQDLPPVEADPAQLDQIIINLAVNSRDAMPTGGELFIETRTMTGENDLSKGIQNTSGWVQLSVRDTGIGMDEETKKHIFEPFYSTKGKEGAGLGMSTVYGIVNQNGWQIELFSTRNVGTTFNIYVPASRDAIVQEKKAPHVHLNGKETILIVEDESDVLEFVSSCLEQAGYSIMQAGEGEEALSIVRDYPEKIDLLISDVIMPNMGGRQLVELLKPDHPELKVIYISGYTDDTITRAGVLEQDTILLQKPFLPQDLLLLVRETLDEAMKN